MGYMSTNIFSTTEEGYLRFRELLEEENVGVKYPITKFEVDEKHGNGRVFGFEWTKWYSSDCEAFQRAWDRFTDEAEHPWSRVRIGEETDDTEECYSDDAWDYAGLGSFPLLTLTRGWDIYF